MDKIIKTLSNIFNSLNMLEVKGKQNYDIMSACTTMLIETIESIKDIKSSDDKIEGE